jgi:hypothetical protein
MSAEGSQAGLRLEIERIDRRVARGAVLAGALTATARTPAIIGAIRIGKTPSLTTT